MSKKNRISVFGKTFHVTPAGKILPLGNKTNWFTKCISMELKNNQHKGNDLTSIQLKYNRDNFKDVINKCKGEKKSKKRIVGYNLFVAECMQKGAKSFTNCSAKWRKADKQEWNKKAEELKKNA